jgi:signal transduction histidine kinase
MEHDTITEESSSLIEKFIILLNSALELEKSKNEDEAINSVAHGVSSLGYPNVMISLLFDNESPPVIRAVSAFGPEWETIKPVTVLLYPGPDVLAEVLERKTPKFIPDSRLDPECNKEAIEKSGIITQYIIPLLTTEMLIGTMQVHMPTRKDKPEIQCKMLDALAGHLSLSISRFRNLIKLQEAEDQIMSVTKFALTNEIASITMHQVKEEIEDFHKIIEELIKDDKIRNNSDVFQRLTILQKKARALSERTARPLQFVMTQEDAHTVSVKDIVQETISNWHDTAEIRGCYIKGVFPADDIFVYILPSHLRELFSCLILNSIQAFARKIEIIVSSELDYCGDSEKELCAVIRVSDDGRGIPPDIVNSIFELGFTTRQRKNQEKGIKKTDIGMFIAKRMAKAMGGDIVVESAGKAVGKSKTVFKITIPLEDIKI